MSEHGRAQDDRPEPQATEASSDPAADPDLVPTLTTASAALATTMTAPKPKSIAPHQLLRRLGGLGMGQVWLAEQTAPVRQQVALQLIRFGVYGHEVLQGFRSRYQGDCFPISECCWEAGATQVGMIRLMWFKIRECTP